MTEIALSLPTKRVSAWMAETEPRYARAWLATLPHADSAETARELYQALYTLNRQDLDPSRRFDLMELYCAPVATVTGTLESYFIRAPMPLTPKKRQLAEFIRQMHIEMAYGYKACLQDLEKQRRAWGKKSLRAQTATRALYYLGEVLAHSYQVYMPYPTEVWREIHAIHRFVAERGLAEEAVTAVPPLSALTTARQEYVQLLLLGLCHPYQLPQNECRQVQHILRHWGSRALLREASAASPDAKCFLVDPESDAPPVPCPRASAMSMASDQNRYRLEVSELLHILRDFIQRLQWGESAQTLSLGIECLDHVCLEILQRLHRAWGETPRRRFSRMPRSGPVSVCTGISALHFFANGQKPFTPPVAESQRSSSDDRIPWPLPIDREPTRAAGSDEDLILLDQPVTPAAVAAETDPRDATAAGNGGTYRVDRWKLIDAGPKGLQLSRFGGSHACVRVGDVIGIQQLNDAGRWSVGAVRWMKSPETGSLEMGVELMAPSARPVAVTSDRDANPQYHPALLLPAIEALRRPVTLLLPRGLFAPGGNLFLAEAGTTPRLVRLLQRLEHTQTFDLLVFADVLTEAADAK